MTYRPLSTGPYGSRKSRGWPLVTPSRRRRRTTLALLFLITCLVIAALYWGVLRTEFVLKLIGPKNLPSLYPTFREQELRLSQQLTEVPFKHGEKYLWVASRFTDSGWGNVMQEIVMTAQLAYATGRGHVYEDYAWNTDGPAYSKFKGKLIPSRVPLSTILAGPIVGGPFPSGDTTPRSIAKAHFDKICPRPYVIHADELRKIYGHHAHGGDADALTVIETWQTRLAGIDNPCVAVHRDGHNVFHPFMFGHQDQVMPVWPSLSSSPVLSSFGWSSLTHDAFRNNSALFLPTPSWSIQSSDPYSAIDGLLAIHVRRGDFLTHCANLVQWGAGFLGFNQFPSFLDPWEWPQGSDEERKAVYLQRCVPSIEQIVDKVEEVRHSAAGQGLRSIYIMTNGDPSWLSSLKDALLNEYQWEKISSSRDMKLTMEQKYISFAVDMMIGQRAQVLVGNGFSSFTSNIAMLRMAKGFPPESTRMW